MNEALRRALTKMSTGDSPVADIMAPLVQQAARTAQTAQLVERHYVDTSRNSGGGVGGGGGISVETDPVAMAALATHQAQYGLGGHIPATGLPLSALAFDPATQVELDVVEAAKVNRAGDTMTGTLSGSDPVGVSDFATKGWVQSQGYSGGLGGQFRAYASTGTINAFNAWVKVTQLTNESWDDDNIWDAVNSRLVIPAGVAAGSRWALNVGLLVSAVPAGYAYASIFKNNAEVERIFMDQNPAAVDRFFRGSAVVPVVAGDVLDVRIQWGGANVTCNMNSGGSYTYIEGWRVK